MLILDAHQDIAFNALHYGWDYTRSVLESRRRAAAGEADARLAGITNGLPDALLGQVGVICATLFADPAFSPYLGERQGGYTTPEEAYRQAIQQWDYYQRLNEEQIVLDLVRDEAELNTVLDTWADGTDLADHHIGLVLLMEGADPIIEPQQLDEWVERGLRIVGPAWSTTRYTHGTGDPGPLTDLGRELLTVMADFNLVLDLSHMTEVGFLESLDRYEGPVFASHANPTSCWDNHRNVNDEQIRRMAERDGVIGISIFNRFLSNDWYRGAPKRDFPLSLLIDAIDHVCQVTGSAAHVGIGSDIDGGFSVSEIPAELDTITDFQLIGMQLRARGYSEADIAGVLSGNFLRVLRRSLSTF
ncbi:MAG: dipeptidase [Anaerolineae bacterium]|nr:dipeptidase [Anaerolineae bacterium]